MAYRINHPSAGAFTIMDKVGPLDYRATFTSMAWVLVETDLASPGILWFIRDSSGNVFDAVFLRSDRTLAAITADDGGVQYGSGNITTALTVGAWYHVALVRASATSLSVFVNGSPDDTATQDMSGRTTAPSNDDYGWFNVDVRLQAIKQWQAALTQDEILREMQTMRPSRFANLNSWFPCLPGAGQRGRDYSGNGYDLAEFGTIVDADPAPIRWGAPVLTVAGQATGVQLGSRSARSSAISLLSPWQPHIPFPGD